jgi:urate oxidase
MRRVRMNGAVRFFVFKQRHRPIMDAFDHKNLADMTLIEVLQLWSESRKQAEKEKQQKCSTKQEKKYRKALTNHETCENRTEKLASLLRHLQLVDVEDAGFIDFSKDAWTWGELNIQVRIAHERIFKTYIHYYHKMSPNDQGTISPLIERITKVFEEFRTTYSKHVESDQVDIHYFVSLIRKFREYIPVWNKLCRQSQKLDPAAWDDAFIHAVFY